ncbi:hypothetical protein K432DRAFT_377071 [Lepidopterella palustris CBS 459.81]|uniref:Uncharacterized protein n=1 Tax=Lepidopterella palustris CBS 459.81 TaxID=1314670 RepID=A0A8E2JKV1_9PEZI|nr:hypothetical protein K432DRAFT_377071 [Lepidopterella palustris CBS 459.81]
MAPFRPLFAAVARKGIVTNITISSTANSKAGTSTQFTVSSAPALTQQALSPTGARSTSSSIEISVTELGRPRTAFVSGHIDITSSQFTENYSAGLDAAIANGDNFIMSNAGGADTMALAYLRAHNVSPDRITIYMHTPRPNQKLNGTQVRINSTRLGKAVEEKYAKEGYGFKVVKGYHTERDTAMTEDSDYDILWVRSEGDTKKLYGAKYRAGRISGTQQNKDRRISKNRRVQSLVFK